MANYECLKKGIFLDPTTCITSNMEKMKQCVDFVILKVSYGTNEGYGFKFNDAYDLLRRYNVPVGVLHSSGIKTTSGMTSAALTEVNNLKKIIAGKVFQYPIYLGLENSLSDNNPIISVFNEQLVSKDKYWMGIYIPVSKINSVSAENRQNIAMWVADYSASSMDKYLNGMWNCTNDSVIFGVPKACPYSYCFVDYPSRIKSKRLNGN